MVSMKALGQSQPLFLSLSPLDRPDPAALRSDVGEARVVVEGSGPRQG